MIPNFWEGKPKKRRLDSAEKPPPELFPKIAPSPTASAVPLLTGPTAPTHPVTPVTSTPPPASYMSTAALVSPVAVSWEVRSSPRAPLSPPLSALPHLSVCTSSMPLSSRKRDICCHLDALIAHLHVVLSRETLDAQIDHAYQLQLVNKILLSHRHFSIALVPSERVIHRVVFSQLRVHPFVTVSAYIPVKISTHLATLPLFPRLFAN